MLQEYRRMGHEWKTIFCHSSLLKKMIIISGEMDQRVRALAHKADDLNAIPVYHSGR